MRTDIEDLGGEALDWGMLPRPNRRLTQLAVEAARCARPLLADDGSLFLGLEINAVGVLRLLWWRRGDFDLVAEISASPAGYCSEETEEGALQEAATALLTYLAGRWPVPPVGLGVITDGRGVAFAPENPTLSAPGWLARQAAGLSTLLAIVPLDPTGPCALLSGGIQQASLH